MENEKGNKNSKNSKEKKKTCKFQTLSVEDEQKQQAVGEPSTKRKSGRETERKRSMKEDEASYSQTMAQDNKRVRLRKKIPVPPLPSKLPPVNLIHRDIVRAWCQQLNLGTKGLKLEAYRRLCEHAYPHQKVIPVTPAEAKVLTTTERKLKMEKWEMTLESSDPSKVTAPPEEGMPALEGLDKFVMTTSSPDTVFSSWTRIAARAGKMEGEESPQEASSFRWCVVHGRSLPAHKEGWVQLQFYAGQTWVPEKHGRVCALFLLPAGKFPPPFLEDNMLCPKCVQRNRVLMKSFQ